MKASLKLSKFIGSEIHNRFFVNRHKRNKKDFTRNRTLTFPLLASHLLNTSKKSMQIECNLLGDLLGHEPVSKQALSLARYKLKPSAFIELHRDVIKQHYEENRIRLWNNFRVFACDGTTLQLAQSDDVTEYFGECSLKVPLARVCQFVEVTSDILVLALIGPYKTGETTLAKYQFDELIINMKTLGQAKQLYLYDRDFPSHDFAFHHLEMGVDFLFRLPKNFNPEVDILIKNGEACDKILVFKRKDFEYKARIILRSLDSGELEVLMTSLLDQEMVSGDSLFKLYHSRWRSEECYKFQKHLLEQENLSSRTAFGLLQEFWASVLLAMMFSIYCKEKEERDAEKHPKEQHRKINRSVVYASIRQTMLRAYMGEIPLKSFEDRFEKLASRHKIAIQDGGSFKRTPTKKRTRRHIYRRKM